MAKYHFMPAANTFKPVYSLDRLSKLASDILNEESGHVKLTECIIYPGSIARHFEVSIFYGEKKKIMLQHDTWTNNEMNKDTYNGAMIDYSEEFLGKIYDKLLDKKYI